LLRRLRCIYSGGSLEEAIEALGESDRVALASNFYPDLYETAFQWAAFLKCQDGDHLDRLRSRAWERVNSFLQGWVACERALKDKEGPK
jgi:hypothetical protein